jgi:putative endonuclease
MGSPNHLQAGVAAEQLAARYLEQRGLHLITCNYRTRAGEIDLIMQDRDELVFVEVRLRNNDYCGDAIDSVNYHKQRKLIQTATHYLSRSNLLDKVNCRFDVIGISYPEAKAVIEWIKDAFPADDF